MKKKITPRIAKAIDIFLDAINEGTLAKGTCGACACANLLASAIGVKPIIHSSIEEYHREYFNNQPRHFKWYKAVSGQFSKEAIDASEKDILLTGFTVNEFKRIERAFERGAKISFFLYHECSKEEIRADQIAGLKAVVEVMLTFDDCQEDVNEVFTKKAELIPLN